MCNGKMILTCCMLLLAISTASSFAGKVLVTADIKSPGTPVTMTAADADINLVLAALFNAAENTRQVRIGYGITGTVESLQLDAVPFDTALTEILAKVNSDFTYTKSDGAIYHIKAPDKTITAPVVTFQQGSVLDDTVKMIKVMLPVIPKTTDTTATVPVDTLDPTADPATVEEKPTAEEAILAVIKVRNINVVDLAEALGYQYLEAFGYSDNYNNTGSRSSSRNRRNDPYYNDPYYNDPYNNDPYYNDPYYNDPYNNNQYNNNNRYNNTTRWTDPNSVDYSRRFTDPNSPYYDRRADPRSRYYDSTYSPGTL